MFLGDLKAVIVVTVKVTNTINSLTFLFEVCL